MHSLLAMLKHRKKQMKTFKQIKNSIFGKWNKGKGSEKHLGGNYIGGNLFPELWKWLKGKFTISTVFDVGCGMAESVIEFEKNA